MPQGSLWAETELARLRLTFEYDARNQRNLLFAIGETRRGYILASSGVTAFTFDEAELLPITAAEAVNGFLYRGAYEAVTQPLAAFRARRKSLRKTS
jgi:hypothetical protein